MDLFLKLEFLQFEQKHQFFEQNNPNKEYKRYKVQEKKEYNTIWFEV